MIEVEVNRVGKIKINSGTSIYDAVLDHNRKLAKKIIAAEIFDCSGNEKSSILVDVDHKINRNILIDLITSEDEKAIDILNHSCAHIMASAIKRIYKKVKFTIGPSIKNGFYYDFDLDCSISTPDFAAIEREMKKIIKENLKFTREEIKKSEAKKLFKDNQYKLELLDEIKDSEISIYKTGDFVDLCTGPHIPATGRVGAFKLLSVAGAYWRGDEKNKMLVRIYGTAFFKKEDLNNYLEKLEKAKRSDHRKIGKDLDLFSFHDEAPGFPFFHPKGMLLQNIILDYWREEHEREGYQEVKTPIILSNQLWKISGHWDHYKDNMYFVRIDEFDYAVKPMNCPGTILVYKSNQHSYKEFPIRYAELGLVHRHEKSGVLHGLFRVRNFTQDDAHIFCLESQLKQEIIKIIDLIDRMYKVFGFEDYHVELSTRPEDRIGSDKMWDRAEEELKEVIEMKKLNYILNEGEGAFYGPKIDFHIKDCLDRTWQCATIQLDFAMPEKFNIEYAGEDNKKHRPVMIHRVVLGSIERFIGILLENYSGNLPPWLSPVQVIVLPISDKYYDYGYEVFSELKNKGYRVEMDNRVESLGKKIRQAEIRKIPYMVVTGQREKQTETITIRRKIGEDVNNIKLKEFVWILKNVVKNKKVKS
ncbi:MAG: threonine--tRNA ligase [Actinobacteria bacterium]|nr:threonine--tRNA ligase [Actinomycetota bacterium]